MTGPDRQADEPLSQAEWIETCLRSGTDSETDYRPLPAVLADHLESFLLNAGAQARHLKDTDLGALIWSVFGCAGSNFETVLQDASEADQTRVYAAFTHFYTTEVPSLCPDAGMRETSTAIYMIWDMDSAEIPLHHPQDWPHLMPVIESGFRTILASTTNETSTTSVLHALFDARFQRPEIESLCRHLAQFRDLPDETREILIGIADGSDYHP